MRRSFAIVGLALVLCSACGFLPETTAGAGEVDPGNASKYGNGKPYSTLDAAALDRGSIVGLRPAWDFYWNRYLPVGQADYPIPDARVLGMRSWTRDPGRNATGHATYRTFLHLPVGKPLAFRFSQQLTAVRVFVDGAFVAEAGSPGTNRANTEPSRRGLEFEYRPKNEDTEIVLQIANYHSFRGGLRGEIDIGPPGEMHRATDRRRFLEVLATGFLGAIALYHFFLFWMQRRQSEYLIFALLCMSFALRITLLGERTINEVFPDLGWAWQYRLGMVHNLVCFPLILLYFRALFPGALGRITTLLILSIAAIFGFSIFVDTVVLGYFLFAYYLIVAGPVIIVSAYIVIKRAIRQRGSIRIMGTGMLAVCVFGLLAMFENWQNRISASDLAILAFLSFGFFQAIGVAQRHKESVENEGRLASRLEKSRAALSRQRQTLENDLHDTLGGRLVDLRIQFLRNFSDHPEFDPHRQQIDDLYRIFRGELLFMEDLEFASRDPVRGLHLSLLRRYSEIGRELRFECEESLQAHLQDDTMLMELLHLTREVCTNDLKYGTGESRWRIKIRSDQLLVWQANRVAATGQDWDGPGAERGGHDAVHASRRTGRLGGSARMRRLGFYYFFVARIPLRAG